MSVVVITRILYRELYICEVNAVVVTFHENKVVFMEMFFDNAGKILIIIIFLEI